MVWQRLKTIGEGYAYLATAGVKEVKASDDATVVFTLEQPARHYAQPGHLCDMALVKQNARKATSGDYGKNQRRRLRAV
ncbi:MAG: hypothetical protein U0401_14765 [Anaerolineae bacterium]